MYIYYFFYIWIVNIHSAYIYIQQFIEEDFHSFQDLCTEWMLILKGGKIQYMAPMRHFKPSTYNRWLSWIFLGHPTLARFQKNSVAFGDQIPGRSGHAGIFDGQCWALQGSRILAWNCYSALHMCAGQNIFHGSRAYALMVLGEEEKYKFGKLAWWICAAFGRWQFGGLTAFAWLAMVAAIRLHGGAFLVNDDVVNFLRPKIRPASLNAD